ncbi:hypothetical protein T440DRAFT_405202 [Plenodomus tracheiphilus IPT5]|uniref:Zn(2)-C6 fungal-type domain-containing protein n=1 Tax=Plenodomus tracheiphilus IPT5 TaxID=1408161 RepID=A0A6A7AW40_9PLEO|nr:hypothetical protein T440DRAFT_405202 [Plenodomus tracheiphilus IPT5]
MTEQRVVKRKTHTKSRKGCFQCKQRHTKCNEARPRCANCTRLDIGCTFPPVGPDGYSTSPQPNATNDVSPTVDQSSNSSPGVQYGSSDLNIADLQLLHHWIHSCADSLHPNKGPNDELVRREYIELGFEFPWLLRGFLALSAIHKASFLLPAERRSLLLQADSHISQSLATYRIHLESPSEECAVPMFVLSSMLLTYNFGSAQLEQPEDPISALHHCFMLLQGIKVVVIPHWEQIKHNSIIARATNMASPETLDALDTLARQDNAQEILRLKGLTELLLASSDKEACALAIDELHETSLRFRHISPDEDEYTLLFLWPARVNPRFFELFAAHNPVACIITTHFAALLAQCRPIWWVVKWPQWLLTAAENMLAATPDLLKWLAWPQQIIHAQASPMVTPGSSH